MDRSADYLRSLYEVPSLYTGSLAARLAAGRHPQPKVAQPSELCRRIIQGRRTSLPPHLNILGRMVTIIMVMDRTLPLANVKAHLSEIVDQVESAHDRVILTRNGRPAAVILSPDDLEALEETLDLLARPEALEAIRKAREELDAGRFLTAAELRERFRRA